MPMSRPNFLLFISDQHRADHLSCYGNAALRTPHIDSIAANGTRFERFHVATPICMPNRATLMTGRMPSLHGARQNGIPLSLNATTFVDLLAAAGYRTALIGKCHLQSMSPTKPTIGMPEPEPTLISAPTALQEADKSIPRHGRYDQELASNWKNPKHDLDLPYYGFQHVELCVNHGDKVVGHYSRWLAARNADWEKLRGPDNQLAGNTYVCIPPRISPNGRKITFRSTLGVARINLFSFSAHFPIRITHSRRRGDIGICTSPTTSSCRGRSVSETTCRRTSRTF
jgi:arylsulfatase A-like enzyme